MTFYILQPLIVLLFYVIIRFFVNSEKKRRKYFLLITSLYLFILEGFRTLDFGADTAWYTELFEKMSFIPWKDLNHVNLYLNVKSETGFNILNKVLYSIFKNAQSLFILVSLVYISSFYKLVSKYSPYVFISFFVFYISYWFQSFYVLRQYLALGICILSIPLILERKLIPFTIIIALTYFIHKSSILFYPAYFIYSFKLRYDLRTSIIFFVTVASAYYIINYMFYDIMLFFEDYETYIDREVLTSGNFKMFLVYLFIMVSYLTLADKKNESADEQFFFKLLVVATTLQLLLQNFGMIQRTNLYYSFSAIIVVPLIISKIENKLLKYLYSTFVVGLYIYIFYTDLIKDRYAIIPYDSILF